MNMPKLAVCPFCGNNAFWGQRGMKFQGQDFMPVENFIACTGCDFMSGGYLDPEEIAKKWNNRYYAFVQNRDEQGDLIPGQYSIKYSRQEGVK